MWFFLFCFCHECPPACPPHQQTQPQQKSSIPIQARSIIHTAIAVLWHTDREGERRREAAEGRESGRDRGKRRGVLVFPKKGSFRDGICMCTQWQHPLCFTVSHVLLLSLPFCPHFAPFDLSFFFTSAHSFSPLLLPSSVTLSLLYLQISTLFLRLSVALYRCPPPPPQGGPDHRMSRTIRVLKTEGVNLIQGHLDECSYC